MTEGFGKSTGRKLRRLGEDALSTAEHIAAGAASGVERILTSDEAAEAVERGKGIIKEGRRRAGEVIQSGRTVAEGVRDAAVRGIGRAGEAVGVAYESLGKAYQKFEDTFYKDGQLDADKVQAVLTDRAKSAQKYGMQAVDFLAREAQTGAKAVVAKYREIAPSKEELRAYRNDGIAVGYKGILFKPELAKCKAFRDSARALLHHGIDERDTILADIGANVITGKRELLDFYGEKGKGDLYTVAKTNL